MELKTISQVEQMEQIADDVRHDLGISHDCTLDRATLRQFWHEADTVGEFAENLKKYLEN